MSLTTVNVSIAVFAITGAALPRGRVRFELSAADVAAIGLVSPAGLTVHLDANGEGTAALWSNADGTQGTQYAVTIYSVSGALQFSGMATVPTNDCNLHEILLLGPPATLDAVTFHEQKSDPHPQYSMVVNAESAAQGAQAIDLTTPNRMIDYGVVYLSGPLTFAPNGSARGASAVVTIVADGSSNVAMDAGVFASDANAGFLMTEGVVNTLHIWSDGVKRYYAFTREANPISVDFPDITAPAFASAEVLNAAPTVLLVTMTENLAGAPPTAASFTVPGKTVVSTSYVNKVISLTLNSAVVASDVPTIAYNGSGGVKDASGNFTAAWMAQAVTNRVGQDVVVRLTNKVTLTESGNATDGWSYIGTSVGFVNYGVCDKSLAASTDGCFTFTQPTLSTANAIIALDTTSTSDAFANYDYGAYAGNAASSTPYTVIRNGSPSASSGGLVPAVGDKLRIRRGGTTIYVERLLSGASTWDLVHSWTGATTAQLYGKVTVSSLITASNLRGDYVS